MSFMLGSIRATLGLDESNFVRGMISAQTAAGIFGQGVVNLVNNPLLGTINLLKSVGGSIFTAVRETAFANQELLRSSQRLNTNVELISALRGAYKGYGQDAGAVERQLTKLNQQIGESNGGNAAAKANFDALGVALRDNAGNARDVNSIFLDVVEGLGKMEDRSRAVAIAQKIFGEDVSRVIDIIGRGRATLDAFTEEARKLGEVFTDEDVRKSNEMANAFDALDRAVGGLRAKLAQGVITGFVGEEFNSESIAETAEVIREQLIPAAEALGAVLRQILQTILDIKEHGPLALAPLARNFSLGPIPRAASFPEQALDLSERDGGPLILGRERARERDRQLRAME